MNITLRDRGFADLAAIDCDRASAGRTTLSVEDAILAGIKMCRPVSYAENLDLFAAAGRVAAQDIRCPCALPRFDHSAMDGYAVRSGSFIGDGPWTFRVAERVAAGDDAVGKRFETGEAVEIFTGAMIPVDFDAVIISEKCSTCDGQFTTAYNPRPGENVRVKGEDVQHDALLFTAGTVLTPHRIALLAAAGIAHVSVIRKIRLALITTGSELKQPGETLAAGQIYNSNRYLLRSMLSHPWLDIHDLGCTPDAIDATVDILHRASMDHDIIVTSGGLSKGGEDHVREALKRSGGSIDVLNVAMRPGKPVSLGTLGSSLFIGLPGNPMAAAVTLAQIALPAIRAITGIVRQEPLWITGFLTLSFGRK